MPGCVICGADHVSCGGPSNVKPVDIPAEVTTMVRTGDIRQKVRDRNGHVFNVAPSEMRAFQENNPGAVIVQAEPERHVERDRPEVEAGGDINAMNVNQLKRYATAQGIELRGADKKGDMLAVIVEHQNANPVEGAESAEAEEQE